MAHVNWIETILATPPPTNYTKHQRLSGGERADLALISLRCSVGWLTHCLPVVEYGHCRRYISPRGIGARILAPWVDATHRPPSTDGLRICRGTIRFLNNRIMRVTRTTVFLGLIGGMVPSSGEGRRIVLLFAVVSVVARRYLGGPKQKISARRKKLKKVNSYEK